MVSTATLKKHTSAKPSTHTKRKLNELGDISNTPIHKQQKQQQQQQQQQQHNHPRHHSSHNSSWQRRQRQQLTNHLKYLGDDDITAPKNKKTASASSTSTPDKPITRLNLKLHLLPQHKQEQEAKEKQQLKCKIKRQLHHTTEHDNYTHRVKQQRQNSQTPPGMNLEEEYMLQEITAKPDYFDSTTSTHMNDCESQEQCYQHRRSKSVTFKLPHDEVNGFESSPLLTPKNDDDSDVEEEILARHKQQLHLQKEQEMVSVYPSTPPESFQHEEEEEEEERNVKMDEVETSPLEQIFSPQSQTIAPEAKSELQPKFEQQPPPPQQQQLSDLVSNNTDYITLASTLPLIQNQRNQIEQEIVQLSQLKSRFNTSSKEETIAFVTKLLQGETGLPKPTPIVTCPYIHWEKYHPTLSRVSMDLQAESNNSNGKDQPFKFVI